MLMFPGGPGRVVRFEDPAVQGSLTPLNMATAPITFEEHKSIITRVTGSPRVNLQLLHTLGSLVYAYVFGDRSSPLQISGLSFARNCDDGDGPAPHGIELVLKWYEDFRAANYNSALRIMVGERGFDALLVGFPFDIADGETGLVSWTAELVTLPERNR